VGGDGNCEGNGGDRGKDREAIYMVMTASAAMMRSAALIRIITVIVSVESLLKS
jgi:hypothetical protein